MTFKELLIKLDACESAKEWARDMPIEEVVATCHRGYWLLWLAKKVDVDLRLRTLVKGHCANTVRHLMTDERSLNAVDVAIAFGEGKATREELYAAAAGAYAATGAAGAAGAAANAAIAAAAAYAYASVDAADAAAYAAADAADAADAAAIAAIAAAYAATHQQAADICRQYIGEALIEKVNQLLTK